MRLIQYPKNTMFGEDGLHLPGTSVQDTETLCGIFKAGPEPEEVDGERPTCPGCINIAKELFLNRGYTKTAVKGW